MKIHPLTGLMLLPILTGCLSNQMPTPTLWTIHPGGEIPTRSITATTRELPARLSRLEVLAPYARTQFCILRPDGSLAFDTYNAFAAPLANTLWSPAVAALREGGHFGIVVGPMCGADTERRLELIVATIALDCRKPGKREARVEVVLNVLNGRALESISIGEAAVPTDDGNYTAAFSTAFAEAVRNAVRQYAKGAQR